MNANQLILLTCIYRGATPNDLYVNSNQEAADYRVLERRGLIALSNHSMPAYEVTSAGHQKVRAVLDLMTEPAPESQAVKADE